MMLNSADNNNTADLTQVRMFKALDNMTDELKAMRTQMSEIVRLEERVNSHEGHLHRLLTASDQTDQRLRSIEVNSASLSSNTNLDMQQIKDRTRRMEEESRRLGNFDADIVTLKDQVGKLVQKANDMESFQDQHSGQKAIWKEIIKWFAGLMAALVVYSITQNPGDLIK